MRGAEYELWKVDLELRIYRDTISSN